MRSPFVRLPRVGRAGEEHAGAGAGLAAVLRRNGAARVVSRRLAGARLALAAATLAVMVFPTVALADWDQFLPPAGSPPGWQPKWVVATDKTALFASATSENVLGGVDEGTFYRIDGPAEAGRYWVYNPLTAGWGWLPVEATDTGRPPTSDELKAFFTPPLPDPRTYLYQRWPDTAARMDCVIRVESRWNPSARNPSSGASGLAQFLGSTWARTPQGRAGLSVYDPYANIDAFGWMVHGGGSWYEWQPVLMGMC